MRKTTIPFAVVAAMALVGVDHVIASNGAGLTNSQSSHLSTGAVKGDRLPVAKAPSTIVARGFSVPAVTVRENAGSAVQPLVVDPKTPAGGAPTASKPMSKPAAEQKLPRGCEAAASPLSSAATSRLHARCVA